MALTLEISPDMETLLRLKAAQSNQDITAYLLKLVESDLNIDLSEHDGLEDYAASVAGVRAGLEDLEAGRTYSAEEVSAMLEIDKAEWRERQAARGIYSLASIFLFCMVLGETNGNCFRI